ncbi:MAG: metal ABC transporter substrate-binding protein [Saccharospirillum sp.]
MRLWVIAFLFALGLTGTGLAQPTITVYSVSYPLAYFAERLAGEATEVVFPVPDDRDPAFWRPPIAVISDYQQADLILLNGAGYADWTANASLPRSALIDTSRAFRSDLIETESVTHSHGGDGEHTHAAVASHIWLDFRLASQQADAVAQALKRFLPAERIDAELVTLKAELAELDQQAAALSSSAPLLASHPRYQYLARRVGVRIESVQWPAGETPTDAQWQALDALLAQEPEARLFLWEAEPTEAAQQGIAERGLTGIWFDLADHPPRVGDFVSRMRDNLNALQEALNTAP